MIRVSTEYDQDSYSFSHEYQALLIRLALLDKVFFIENRQALQPQYFQDVVHRDVLEKVHSYLSTYNTTPTREELTEIINECEGDVAALLAPIEITSSNAKAMGEAVRKFEFHQQVRQALLKVLDHFQTTQGGFDTDTVVSYFRDVVAASSPPENRGLVLLDDVVEAGIGVWTRKSRFPISTGLEALDEAIDGGLGIGELGIIEAPPKTGKTTLLTSFFVNALVQKKNALYVSCEATEGFILNNIYTAATSMTDKERYIHPNQAMDTWRAVMTDCGVPVVKCYRMNSASVIDIRQLIDIEAMSSHWEPHFVVVDYGDIIKAPPGFRPESPGDANKEKYRSLVGLAQELEIPVWTAAQTNFKTGEIAGSHQQFGDAHCVIKLDQTKADKEFGRASLTVRISRTGSGFGTIPIELNYARRSVIEIETAATDEDDEDEIY